MSITLNAAFLQAQFNDSSITATNAEVVLDGGINMLNAYGASISNLSGSAGSKTGSYSSTEVGAVMAMAQQIYQKHFKNASGASSGMGGLNLSYSSDSQLLTFAQRLAFQLKGRSFERT